MRMMHACVCECMKGKKRNICFIANMADLIHFNKSMSAPGGNLHRTIYEPELTVSVQLLGPTEKTAADMNLMEERHLVVSLRAQPIMCFLYFMMSVHERFSCSGARTSLRVTGTF